MITPKPEHKFFEKHLDNDLNSLSELLEKYNQQISDGLFPGITKEMADEAQKTNCMATQLSPEYNIFQIPSKELHSLFVALRDLTKEACEYYGVDFEKERYYLQGWFNYDGKSADNKDDLHDHSGGKGAPSFHGYYCVNAEPSITHYQINREKLIENINLNNRAIVSETGHPHRKGKWSENEKRITIAYDMLPMSAMDHRLLQHWIPLI